MDIDPARRLATALIAQHGLTGWRFVFDRAKRRFGCCNFTSRTISLSRPLTLLNGEPQVRDTILHEIAHALTPRAGHGPAWRAMCLRIGAAPQRCFRPHEVITPPTRPAVMQIGCPACNWWHDRRRRLSRKLICRKCRAPVVVRGCAAGRMKLG